VQSIEIKRWMARSDDAVPYSTQKDGHLNVKKELKVGGTNMLGIPPLSIESIIPIGLTFAWGSISAYQILAAKLRKRRCVICTRGVQHDEQASGVVVPCHEVCHYMANLIARPDNPHLRHGRSRWC
jgi:hypothetical protein